MSHSEKAFWYNRLKDAGWEPEQHYRMYTTEDLQLAYERFVEAGAAEPATYSEAGPYSETVEDPVPAGFFGLTEEQPKPKPEIPEPRPPARPALGEMAGERLNTKDDEEVLRVDEHGRQWLQEEVLKPAFPKPRGRRVLRYNDPGVRKETTQVGEYTETFEVSGDPRNSTPSEIKITLPSYQVGIYRDPRYPFKVITYNGKAGFDRIEVETYYGGAELVPPIAKRTYVENVLCYDMRSVIRAINEEYRQLLLSGRA